MMGLSYVCAKNNHLENVMQDTSSFQYIAI